MKSIETNEIVNEHFGGKSMQAHDATASSRRAGWATHLIGRGLVSVLAALVFLSGCDFDVSNPGPVADGVLDDPGSHAAVVEGVKRAYIDAWNQVALETSAATREIMASGNLNISVAQGQGVLLPDESNGMWGETMNVRWISDDAIRRFEEVGTDAATMAEAHLWAGFAYRLAGETFCQAVFDGGPAEPHTEFLEGAVDHFTEAASAADEDVRLAALAGRASAHANLGDWSAAAADASQVPDDFEFLAPFSAEEPDQNNFIAFYVANAPYRVHSVWNTPNEEYYTDTGDPRVPWGEDPDYPFGEVQRPGIGNVPWLFQLKYPNLSDDVRIASGWEMRLVEAEAILTQTPADWMDALDIINEVRTRNVSDADGLPLDPWVATDAAETWTALRRERGVELWLEARRLSDMRRWSDTGAPGEMHPLEDASNPDTYLDPDRDLCVPIAQDELETNPNLTP